jgi:hypothetical protein
VLSLESEVRVDSVYKQFSMKSLFYLFAGFLFLLSACRSGSNGRSTLLPNITGKPGQILVVAPVQIKDTPLADSLRAVLGAE